MRIVLLGLFRFRVAGLCCWVVLIPGASILLLGLFLWFVFLGLLPVGCVDSGVIPVWVGGCGSMVVWVKK